MTEFTSEAALASAVSNWMRADGWRTMQHRGCHRYLFGLHPAVRRKLTGLPHLPYPKLEIPRL